ncbi:MAG: SDR family oxidoreductase [Halobacteriovoraceae bacterium]|nr:SDR family oxidoreductase [Halobacteriovoraceae bacterium]
MAKFNKFENIKIGDTASLIKLITEDDIRKFVEMTGDNNPLHTSKSYAETTSFKDIVVHGMLGASFISTIIGMKLPGEGALWMSQAFEFHLPVRLGDELTISCTVIKKNDGQRVLELAAKIVNQNNKVILSGNGKVKLLETTKELPRSVERKKVVIVTGGTGGIGTAICEKLASDGYKVVVNYRGNKTKAINLVDKIKKAGGEATAIQADITDPKAIARLVDETTRIYQGLDCIVNNASPKINQNNFEKLEYDEISSHMDVQLKAAFLMCKAAYPVFKEQKYGKIINMTSQVLDGVPSVGWTSYALGKSALATLSRYMAAELGPLGITVNCVSPGMTDTALIGDIPEKSRLLIARATPLRRLAMPTDIAGAVSYLASECADYITGETIRINGGQVMM